MESFQTDSAPPAGNVASPATMVGPARRSVRAGRLTHALILAGALAVPVLGWLMTPVSGGQVAFSGLESYPLPTLCLSRRLGWDCPTCGVTRSMIALVQGELLLSLSKHRFGWLVLLNFLAQIPYRGYRLMHPGRPLPRLEWAGLWLLVATGVIVVANRFLEAFGLL